MVQSVTENGLVLADPESGPTHAVATKDFAWSNGFEVPERRGWFAAVRRKLEEN